MRMLIWFVVIILIGIEISKQPMFVDWVDEMERKALNKASDAVGKTSLSKITAELEQLKDTISDGELSYLKSNISTMEQAKRFKVTYCDTSSRLTHVVLTEYSFEQICTVLNKHIE